MGKDVQTLCDLCDRNACGSGDILGRQLLVTCLKLEKDESLKTAQLESELYAIWVVQRVGLQLAVAHEYVPVHDDGIRLWIVGCFRFIFFRSRVFA